MKVFVIIVFFLGVISVGVVVLVEFIMIIDFLFFVGEINIIWNFNVIDENNIMVSSGDVFKWFFEMFEVIGINCNDKKWMIVRFN